MPYTPRTVRNGQVKAMRKSVRSRRLRHMCRQTARCACTIARKTAVPATPAVLERGQLCGALEGQVRVLTKALGLVELALVPRVLLVHRSDHVRRAGDNEGVGGNQGVVHRDKRRAQVHAEFFAAWRALGDARLEVGRAKAVLHPDDEEAFGVFRVS